MARISNTAFEVKNSNIRNNDLQTLAGYFGSFADTVFTGDICPAGFVVESAGQTPCEGYESFGIYNSNTHYFITAADGIVSGCTGDHTGLYCFDSYGVNEMTDIHGNVYRAGANTLGLELPANVRGDFVELIVGERYKWGAGNFSTLPDENKGFAVLTNGRWVAQAAAPTDGSVYLKIEKDLTPGFEAGTRYRFDGYVGRVLRSTAA